MKLQFNIDDLRNFYFLDAEKISYPNLEFLIKKDPAYDEKFIISEGSDFVIGVKRKDRGYIKLMHGYNSKLLKQLEQRLREEKVKEVRVFESAPRYMFPGVDPRYTGIYIFFLNDGYKVFDYTFNMFLELTHVYTYQKIQGVDIIRAKASHHEEVRIFLKKHFPPWEEEVLTSFMYDPPRLVISLQKGRIVGFSAFDTNNPGVGWFGPMGVNSGLRGKGIGRALLLETLNFMKEVGYKKVIIPWVGPVAFYYKTVGATINRIFLRMKKML